MAKQQTKHQVVKSQQGQGVLVENVFDDNLLPDASEIEKLYKLDNNILEWLKGTAEKEQNFRHQVFAQKLEITEKVERGRRQISKMGITFSFIIVLVAMVFSGFLIYIGQTVVGTVFAGGIIISIVTAFLKKVKE
jgi:hypothetical protein|nr:MAG TPA: putative membrane protein [Caudoviricetes sp.]